MGLSCLIGSCLLVAMSLQPCPLNRIEQFVVVNVPHLLKERVAPFHRSWYNALGDRSTQYLCLEAGRGSAKTTCGSVIFSLFNICESDDEEMQVASRSTGSTGTASKIITKIKRELETNKVMICKYGLKRGRPWGQEHLQVIRGDGHVVDFYSLGKHSSIRGSRGTVLIDDPQNAADCRSEAVLLADEEWLFTDVLPVIIGDQRLIFIGTPISPLSLCCKIKRLPGWKVLSFPMEDPPGSGRSAWPEQYSDEFLAERQTVMGRDMYAAEYLCQPRVSGNPVFKEEWFKGYEPDSVQFQRLKNDGLYHVVGFDGADSKSSSADHTAIVTIGATFTEKPNIYVLDVRRQRWTMKEGAEQLFMVFEKFQQHKSVVESRCVAPNKDPIIEELDERQRIYGKYVNVYQVKPVHDKVTRAMQVQSLFQEGRVHFDLNNKDQRHLIDELTMFTGGGTFSDDCVDALVYALTEVKGWQHTKGMTIKSALDGKW